LLVLVGFMASGKSTVGRELARRLGWRFVDLDDRVEALACATVPEIFRRWGEERFRDLEGQAGREALLEEHVVLATGGGWPTAPGRMDGVPEDVLTIWLRVSPEDAVERAGRDDVTRPLLEVADPADRARRLLDERRDAYAKARVHVETGGRTPETVIEQILERIES
jgi:shikimate kinase